MCKCHPGHEVRPQPEQESIFRTFLLSGLDLEIYLDGIWGRRLKKVVNFLGKKVHPQTKSWLRLCLCLDIQSSFLVRRYIFGMVRSSKFIKVIGSKGQGQSVVFTGDLLSTERLSCLNFISSVYIVLCLIWKFNSRRLWLCRYAYLLLNWQKLDVAWVFKSIFTFSFLCTCMYCRAPLSPRNDDDDDDDIIVQCLLCIFSCVGARTSRRVWLWTALGMLCHYWGYRQHYDRQGHYRDWWFCRILLLKDVRVGL